MAIPLDKSFYLVCGDDEFRVDVAVHELLDALVPEADREFGLDKIDGRGDLVADALKMMRDVRDALVADGLFGGSAKTVWLRDPSFLSAKRVTESEQVKDALAAWIKDLKNGIPDGNRLVVSTSKINRAQAFFKFFKGAGHVIDFGSDLKGRAKTDAAAAFLAEYLPKSGIKMPFPVQKAFLARVGTDSRQIVSELEKLSCYCGKGATATEEDVANITSFGAVSEVWDFTDALCFRDPAALARQIKIQLDQGENAIRLTQSALSCVSDLLFVRDAMDRGWLRQVGSQGVAWNLPEEIDRGLTQSEKDIRSSLSGFRAKKILQQATRWKTSELRAARHHLVVLREELVSTQLPVDYLLETRLIQAIGPSTKRSS